MLVSIYIALAIMCLIAQRHNGLFTAVMTALFWPIILVFLVLSPFVMGITAAIRRGR